MKFVNVTVPVCVCEQEADGWKVKRENTTVKAIANKDGTSNAETVVNEHEELFKANSELCLAKNREFEAHLSVPDWWPGRRPQVPQLAIQYAEDLGGGKNGRSRWTLILPHYAFDEKHKPSFPRYKKGDYMGVYQLADNSKIIVNAANKTECIRVINALKQYISPDILAKSSKKPPNITETQNDYKKVTVIPVFCQFFLTGQKDEAPVWSKRLK